MIGRMVSTRLISLLLFALLACSSLAASVRSGRTEFAWQRECVGQFEFELPGKVDLPIPRWADEIDGWSSYAFVPQATYNPANKFLGARDQRSQEGVQAWGSTQEIDDVPIFPGPDIAIEDFALLQEGIGGAQEHRRKRLKVESGVEDTDRLKLMPGATKDTFIWEYRSGRDVFLWRGGHTFLYREHGGIPVQKINGRVRYVVENLRARDTFEVPKGEGMCIQGGFLPEVENPGYAIGVTYRLKEHPEVEIFFKAITAAADFRVSGNLRVPDKEVRFFWEANYGADDKQHKLIHLHIPGVVQFPNVTIGGYKGKSSFVELTHKDDSVDYGYMAYVMGDADGERFPPTLMLYVIRTASRAKGEPLSKDQIKEIAERIASSVRRRALTQ